MRDQQLKHLSMIAKYEGGALCFQTLAQFISTQILYSGHLGYFNFTLEPRHAIELRVNTSNMVEI